MNKKTTTRAPGSSDPSGATPGVVHLVGSGPGDPGLLTLRAAELLATADLVLVDDLVHPAVLDRVREGAEVRWVHTREEPGADEVVVGELIAAARAGKRVVRLEGGDPFFFGRGSEEAATLAGAGVAFEVVPGVPSPTGAAAYAGISLTHGDLSPSVTVVGAAAALDWSSLAEVRGTVCVLLGAQAIEEVAAALLGAGGRAADAPAAVIAWGTRAEQRVVEARLGEVAARARQAGLSGPAVVVVGQVAELRSTLRWFDARPLFGKRVLVTRPAGQGAATAELLRRRGAEPIELPAIEIVAPPDPARVVDAARGLDRYDVVAFTSENGVTWFFRALDAEGKDARAFGRARVATIGPGTAAALAARGVRADILPSEFRGEGLADAILADPEVRARLARGPVRVLIPRALVAREVLGEMLRERGCEVDIVPVYETRPASADRRDELLRRLEARALDVVMLTSSSTADSVCELLGPRAPELLRDVLVASIGPITTKTAEGRGLTVGVTAAESTTLGLLASLEQHFDAERSTRGDLDAAS